MKKGVHSRKKNSDKFQRKRLLYLSTIVAMSLIYIYIYSFCKKLQDKEIKIELNIDNQYTIVLITNKVVKIKTYRC